MNNREIKFRAWDKKWNKMYSYPFNDGICVYGNGLFDVQRLGDDGHAIETAEGEDGEIVLMQYTGLKDVRGREVYERDVVEAKSFVPQRYVVEFIEGGFCLTNPKMKGHPIDINLMYPSTGCQFSVIGNIYEHGNLLEK